MGAGAESFRIDAGMLGLGASSATSSCDLSLRSVGGSSEDLLAVLLGEMRRQERDSARSEGDLPRATKGPPGTSVPYALPGCAGRPRARTGGEPRCSSETSRSRRAPRRVVDDRLQRYERPARLRRAGTATRWLRDGEADRHRTATGECFGEPFFLYSTHIFCCPDSRSGTPLRGRRFSSVEARKRPCGSIPSLPAVLVNRPSAIAAARLANLSREI